MTDYEKRLLRVIDHIYANPAGDLSLDALADVAAMSRFHWHRIFHAMTGETAAEAVRRVRMHRATFWLVGTNLPMDQIAEAVGYPSVRSFTRAFAERRGMTPTAFRKQGIESSPLNLNRKGSHSMFDVAIRQEPARTLIAVAHKGPYTNIAQAFEKLGAMVQSRNLWPHAGSMLGVYYDDPSAVKPEVLRSHAGLVFDKGQPMPEGFDAVQLPGGTTAVLRFRGHYSGLPAAYDYLYGQWLPASGQEADDSPVFEIYINTPMDTKPEDLLTDICVPLAG